MAVTHCPAMVMQRVSVESHWSNVFHATPESCIGTLLLHSLTTFYLWIRPVRGRSHHGRWWIFFIPIFCGLIITSMRWEHVQVQRLLSIRMLQKSWTGVRISSPQLVREISAWCRLEFAQVVCFHPFSSKYVLYFSGVYSRMKCAVCQCLNTIWLLACCLSFSWWLM